MKRSSVGQKISFDDACLILNGWSDSRVLIFCQSRVGRTRLSLRGRVSEIDSRFNVSLVTELGDITFGIGSDLECVYTDSRDFPRESKIVCSLFFFFPQAGSEEDFIALSELEM